LNYDIQRHENESFLDYCDRLIDAKDNNLIDIDKAEIWNILFGEQLSSDEVRKRLYGVKKVVQKLKNEGYENITEDKILKELDIKKTEFQKERNKFFDQRKAYTKIVRESARYENFMEILNDSINNSTLPVFEYIPNTYKFNKKIMVCAFSDFHYGLEFSNYWGKYNKQIFEERFNKYLSRIIDIGEKNQISDIIVIGLGDLISGNIHVNLRVNNAEDIITQTQEVSEYIANGLYELSKHFNHIDFHNIIGNHGRVNSNKDESLYVENFERFVPWYCKTRLKNIENITICENDIDQGVVMQQLNGNIIVGVHGDKDHMNNAVQNLTLMLGVIPTSVWLGHLHHFASDTIQGVSIVMSGSLSGTCDHSKNIRKVGDACQTVGIYDNGNLECLYNVILN
jgi:predicted phosphodiesterase